MLSFFPRDVLAEILNLIESVSEGFPTYSCNFAWYIPRYWSKMNFSTFEYLGSINVFLRFVLFYFKQYMHHQLNSYFFLINIDKNLETAQRISLN